MTSLEPIIDESTGELLVEPIGIAEGEDGCRRCDYERRRAAAHERRAETLKSEVHEAERDLRNKRARITTLENELNKQQYDDPDYAVAKGIYGRWVEESGRNPKRTKFGDTRSKRVIDRLRQYDPEYVLDAVIAGVRTANVNNREVEREALIAALHEAIELLGTDTEEAKQLRDSYRQRMSSTIRFDDLELICRNEPNLERFHAAAVRMGIASE